MSSALSDDDSRDRIPAARAAGALLSVDVEMILKFSAAINPVDTGAVAANAFGQNGADRRPKRPEPVAVHARSPLRRE